MAVVSMGYLLEAGVHFGHQTKRWNPKMKEYIFTAREGIYIIDLQKTVKKIEEAYVALREIAQNGGKVIFVGTKKQAQEASMEEAIRSDSYYVTERWLGGTLTNFRTIKRRIGYLDQVEKMEANGTLDVLPKKEVIKIKKEYDKLNSYFCGIRNMKKLPDAMIITDPKKEYIAIKEARKLGIPVFGIVDTNCDPDLVDYVIPANDDAVRAVKIILGVLANAINEGTDREMVDFLTDDDKNKNANKESKKESKKSETKEVKAEAKKEEVLLEVKNLNRKGVFKDINFSLRKGEILGISGLMGAGRTEVMRGIFGIDPIDSGEIFINDKKVTIKTEKDAINHGIGFVTENRRDEGLVLSMDVKENITLGTLNKFLDSPVKLNLKSEVDTTNSYIEKLKIKTAGYQQKTGTLSGGNQQKIVIAKWLLADSKILIVDEPTRGIDVGAKLEIYNIMNELVKSGVGIIMISSELPEVLGMSDRILVMCRGEITGELSREEADQEKIMYYATGGGKYDANSEKAN